ncbi:hypothetical protein [Flammeovirga pacifica]|uniref:Uncharacterized protein n=1 Tax=Flammeovirga pacifica TaxID=915059 RepID=A0A1S1Z2B4_FLAPC|nr:hypothetical protein [Flammeovirga pacifica]OHX67419.1 hypothetical protein NH26_14240 [Flammeovirga pacifica]
MKNLSFILLSFLSISLFSCGNNNDNENPNNPPSISIENQQDILEVYPLQRIQLNVLAKTTSDLPVSDVSATGDGNCIQNQDTTLNANEGYLNYNQLAPYSKGDYTISFTAYNDGGKTSNIEQKIKVIDEPFMIDIDSSNVPSSATENTTFTLSGTLKSVLPFDGTTTSVDLPTKQSGIKFSTSVLDASFDAVIDNSLTSIPHSVRTSFEVTQHTLTKDINGYYTYNFNVTYTVRRPEIDSDIPQSEFRIYITYNYFDATINCTTDGTAMFGTWSKTVNIE